MPALPHGVRVFVCTHATDKRKSFDGLVGLTRQVLGQDPVSGDLFVFVNRRATMVKVLYWSRGGFCLWAKRLERGRFAAFRGDAITATLTDTQLMMWLDGIDLHSARQTMRFDLPARRAASATMRA